VLGSSLWLLSLLGSDLMPGLVVCWDCLSAMAVFCRLFSKSGLLSAPAGVADSCTCGCGGFCCRIVVLLRLSPICGLLPILAVRSRDRSSQPHELPLPELNRSRQRDSHTAERKATSSAECRRRTGSIAGVPTVRVTLAPAWLAGQFPRVPPPAESRHLGGCPLLVRLRTLRPAYLILVLPFPEKACCLLC
jgi:hypothetical protein